MHEFKKNKFYYAVTFIDHELRIPVIQTLKYIGEESESKGNSVLLFNEINSTQDEKLFFVHKEHSDSLIMDYEMLLKTLNLSIRGKLPSKGLPS